MADIQPLSIEDGLTARLMDADFRQCSGCSRPTALREASPGEFIVDCGKWKKSLTRDVANQCPGPLPSRVA